MLYGYVLSDGCGNHVVHVSPDVTREVDHTRLVAVLTEETDEWGMLYKKAREFSERNNVTISNLRDLGPEVFPTPDEERDMLRKSVRDLSRKLADRDQWLAATAAKNQELLAERESRRADGSAVMIAHLLNKVIRLETIMTCALSQGCTHLQTAYDEHCAILEGENPLVFLQSLIEH